MEGNAAMQFEELRGAYLDLLRNCITGLIADDPPLDGSGVFRQRGVA